MATCLKERQVGTEKVLCGHPVYKDGRCFPHWNRVVTRAYLKSLDREFTDIVSHSIYYHKCPKSGHKCPYKPTRPKRGKWSKYDRALLVEGLSVDRSIAADKHGIVRKEVKHNAV